MNQRTGKECDRMLCKNYDKYSRWARWLGSLELTECMNCKYAHVSQYKKRAIEEKK